MDTTTPTPVSGTTFTHQGDSYHISTHHAAWMIHRGATPVLTLHRSAEHGGDFWECWFVEDDGQAAGGLGWWPTLVAALNYV